jgi:hypothetical protein
MEISICNLPLMNAELCSLINADLYARRLEARDYGVALMCSNIAKRIRVHLRPKASVHLRPIVPSP